jgi:hypothetical protein
MSGFDEILTEANIPHALVGDPSMFGLILGSDQTPLDFREYFNGDGELYERLALELIHRGCYALSEEDVNETLNVFNESVKAAKA